MEEKRKIKVGITHGDVNGIGYETILKAFSDPTMFEICIPVVYGSPKVMTYHRKALELQNNFSIISSPSEAGDDRLYVINTCGEEEPRVEFGRATEESAAYAVNALERLVEDYKNGFIDVIVTSPVNANSLQCEGVRFYGNEEYLHSCIGAEGAEPLQVYVNGNLRVASVTSHLPIREVAAAVTAELVEKKIKAFYESLRYDFIASAPCIAVLSLNPEKDGKEETETIAPVIEKVRKQGIQCFGPYSSSDFFGSGAYEQFDGILAMYDDQASAPFKALAPQGGVKFMEGLSAIATAPAHGAAHDIAGKGVADEASLREAIYTAVDIYRNRIASTEARRNPLRKQYFEKRDDSDKLRLDQPEKND